MRHEYKKQNDIMSLMYVNNSSTNNLFLGLAWSSGAWWKEQRTFALTTMRKIGFGKMCLQGQVMEEVDCLMDEFEKYEGRPFNIHYQLKISVSNVICSLLFGKRFEYEDAKFRLLMELINKLLTVVNFSSPAFIFPSLSRFSIFNFDKANPTIKALCEFIHERVEEHRQTFDENNIRDYIDAYLVEQKQRTSERNTTFTGEITIKSERRQIMRQCKSFDCSYNLYGM